MKRQLFDQDDANPEAKDANPKPGMKVNKDFAEKYEKREQKKLLAKSKFMESDLDSEESEYSDEDEEGVLINSTVEQKFIDTIARIRANDPKLKKLDKDIFEDEDFALENIQQKEPEEKPTTFKSLMVDKLKRRFGEKAEKNIDEAAEDSEADEEVHKETDVMMQRRLKADFLAAAEEEAKSDDDLLQVKEKTKEQIQKEKEEFEKIALEQNEKRYDEDKVLKDFWGKSAEKKLSAEDRFLRSYILGEKWKEANDDFDEKADEEDLDRDSEIEEFEENYNFRFEERDGDVIRTYPRTIEDTYRIARNKRMEKKIEKKKRMKAYLKEKKQEQEQIFALKKKEIIDKLKEAEKIAGSEIISKKILKELETDFDPVAYDKSMAKAFDENYYEEDDDKDKVFEKTVVDDYGEVINYENKPKESDDQDAPMQEQQNDEPAEENEEGEVKHQQKKREIKEAFKQLEEGGQFDVWYSCDGCIKPIKPGKFRFDCKICENFTFCDKCFKNNDTHSHPFKKKKVPVSYEPPENNEQLLSQAFALCFHCRKSMLRSNEKVFECKTCECFICKQCKKTHSETELESGTHEITVSKEFQESKAKAETKEEDKEDKKEYLDGMLDEYYKLGFEDIIGKDIYTRFKYAKVKDFDFGLTNEEIMLLNDKELNKLVSLKKYKPYRNDEELTNLHRVKALKKKLASKLDVEKHQLKQILKQDIKIQKEKLLGIKTDAKEVKRDLVRNAKIRDKQQDKKLNQEVKEEKRKLREKKAKNEENTPADSQQTEDKQAEGGRKRDRKSLYLL